MHDKTSSFVHFTHTRTVPPVVWRKFSTPFLYCPDLFSCSFIGLSCARLCQLPQKSVDRAQLIQRLTVDISKHRNTVATFASDSICATCINHRVLHSDRLVVCCIATYRPDELWQRRLSAASLAAPCSVS